MPTRLENYEEHSEKPYQVLDVFSDSLNKNGLRFCPQIGDIRDLGIWDYNHPGGSNALYLEDETVDDLITYLEYYKHKKMEEGEWTA